MPPQQEQSNKGILIFGNFQIGHSACLSGQGARQPNFLCSIHAGHAGRELDFQQHFTKTHRSAVARRVARKP